MITHKHHIIPRHAGGTDDPSNLVGLTVEEHANAHKVLYEKEGRWQDKLAWQGLSGQISMDKAKELAILEGGSKGRANLSTEGRKRMSANATCNNLSRTPDELKAIGKKISESKKGTRILTYRYKVVAPDGTVTIADDLKMFCKENNLKSNKMYTIATPTSKEFGHKHYGYLCSKIEE